VKEAQSSFDVMASVKELRALVGGHIDKIYHPTLDHLILAVRLPGEEKTFVHFWVGRWLYVSRKGQQTPGEPSDFAMMLRKRLTNATVAGVAQQGFDRIAVLTLEKEERFQLVLEMFGDGNVILVKDGTIVQPLTSHTWKHRDVRARKEFMFPPPVPVPSELTAEGLLKILQSSDTDIVRTVATRLNTGGRYSEEICARAGLDKRKKAKDATEADARLILGVIREFTEQIESSGRGYIVLKDSVVEDVVPVKMRIYEGLTTEEFETYSSAVESYVGRIPRTEKEKPRETVLELERLKRKLAQQEAAAQKLQDDAREAQIMGDFLFANYGEVAKALSLAKDRVLDSEALDDVPGFVSYDARNSLLRLNIRSVEVQLDIKGSVESNAQRYYEEAKRARKKLEGVLVALGDARRDIEDQMKEIVRPEHGAKSKHEPTKRFWFERFRWFISSEGAIVLGGKDAKSNDLLVKKHLGAGDRYAHADIHGAPSVVVKMMDGVTDQTLHEACEFAVAVSRAWNAKIGAAAGYWVLPEQVSKTPQSGEYLAKGAFVIRGKRNYTDKLEIKLGIGEIEFEGARKIMCAPERAVRVRSKRFVIIRPGEMDKNDFAKKLAGIFEVPIEEIQSILPPGNVDIVEQVGLVIS
jgi:predicted ribosome quality control (RQC) complex YloA/Tae2 family protein